MTRATISLVFILLIPFLKFERILADVKKGRRIAMIQLYHSIMDSRRNPLSHIPDTNTRHLVMQLLAWMWCIVFSMWMGSIFVFGVSAAIHAILLAGIFVTVGVLKQPNVNPSTLVDLAEPAVASTNKDVDDHLHRVNGKSPDYY